MITVCCQCRRLCGPADERGYRHAAGPELTRAQQENASHSICVNCFVATYGALDDEQESTHAAR